MASLQDEIPHWSKRQRRALARAIALAVYADFEADEDEHIELAITGPELGLSVELDEALDWARDLPNEELTEAVQEVCEKLPVAHHPAVFTLLMGFTLSDLHQNLDETYVMKKFAQFMSLEEK